MSCTHDTLFICILTVNVFLMRFEIYRVPIQKVRKSNVINCNVLCFSLVIVLAIGTVLEFCSLRNALDFKSLVRCYTFKEASYASKLD